MSMNVDTTEVGGVGPISTVALFKTTPAGQLLVGPQARGRLAQHSYGEMRNESIDSRRLQLPPVVNVTRLLAGLQLGAVSRLASAISTRASLGYRAPKSCVFVLSLRTMIIFRSFVVRSFNII